MVFYNPTLATIFFKSKRPSPPMSTTIYCSFCDRTGHVAASCPNQNCNHAGCNWETDKYTGLPDTNANAVLIHFLKCRNPSAHHIVVLYTGSPPWALPHMPAAVPCYWCGLVPCPSDCKLIIEYGGHSKRRCDQCGEIDDSDDEECACYCTD